MILSIISKCGLYFQNTRETIKTFYTKPYKAQLDHVSQSSIGNHKSLRKLYNSRLLLNVHVTERLHGALSF